MAKKQEESAAKRKPSVRPKAAAEDNPKTKTAAKSRVPTAKDAVSAEKRVAAKASKAAAKESAPTLRTGAEPAVLKTTAKKTTAPKKSANTKSAKSANTQPANAKSGPTATAKAAPRRRLKKDEAEAALPAVPLTGPVEDPIGDTTDGEAHRLLALDGEAGTDEIATEAHRASESDSGPRAAQAAFDHAPVRHGKDSKAAGEASRESRSEPPIEANLERLQKILSQAGVASRRHAEEMIAAGRVMVNGQVITQLGSKADPERDHIRVDGKLIQGAERRRTFLLNKPKGFVTTVSDPEGRPTVMQFFEKMRERLYPVGRLDYQSEGLLLMTNDGELANKVTRAGAGVEKIYLVKVSGQPSEEALEQLRAGVTIDREQPGFHPSERKARSLGAPGSGRVVTAPASVRQVRAGDNPWFEVVLIEGRNRELRKMFQAVGHFVEKIRRVGYGPLVLDVEPGQFRELTPDELHALRLAAEGKLKPGSPSTGLGRWGGKPRRPKSSAMLPREAGRPAQSQDDRGRRRDSSRRVSNDRWREPRREPRSELRREPWREVRGEVPREFRHADQREEARPEMRKNFSRSPQPGRELGSRPARAGERTQGTRFRQERSGAGGAARERRDESSFRDRRPDDRGPGDRRPGNRNSGDRNPVDRNSGERAPRERFAPSLFSSRRGQRDARPTRSRDFGRPDSARPDSARSDFARSRAERPGFNRPRREQRAQESAPRRFEDQRGQSGRGAGFGQRESRFGARGQSGRGPQDRRPNSRLRIDPVPGNRERFEKRPGQDGAPDRPNRFSPRGKTDGNRPGGNKNSRFKRPQGGRKEFEGGGRWPKK